jgi:hypothetical protein
MQKSYFKFQKLIFFDFELSKNHTKRTGLFFKLVEGAEFSVRKVTKSAFTQARAKMDPLLFKRLNKVASDTFYTQAKHNLWHNYRVLAIDGSRVALPNHRSIKEEFGEHSLGPKADSISH